MTAISNYVRCKNYFGRKVKIKSRDGNTYIGKIIKLDKNKVHLKVSSVRRWKKDTKAHTSLFFFPFVLPLVLFDLLAITLLF